MKHRNKFEYCIKHNPSNKITIPKGGDYAKLDKLLKEIYMHYNFDMKLNYIQLYLWQKNFCSIIDNEAILAAGKFVIFCCLVDKFLDSPRFSENNKNIICEKLNQIINPQPTGIFIEKFPELDKLIEPFLQFYHKHLDDTFYTRENIFSSIKKAILSEIFMYQSVLTTSTYMKHSELDLLLDKSIEFEKAAFLTASFGHNTPKSVLTAETLGRIFWLIDDLCDFVEDIREHRKNSLLVYCVPKERKYTLECRVEIVYKNLNKAILQLEKDLSLLKSLVDEDFYCFMVVQIWNWSFRIRHMIEQ